MLLPSDQMIVKKINYLRYNRFSYYNRVLDNLALLVNERFVDDIVSSQSFLLKKLRFDNLFLIVSMRCKFTHDFYSKYKKKFDELSSSNFKYIKYLYASKCLSLREYTQKTEKLFLESIRANRDLISNFRYLDFVVQRYGYKDKRLNLPLRRFVDLNLSQYMTKSQKARLSSILFERGMILEGEALLKDIGKCFVANKSCYLGLAFHANKYFKYKDSNLVLATRMYSHIQKKTLMFADFVRENKDDLCIVGNAPCELGKGNGKRIDSHKVVVRFNNYSLSNFSDYGKKETVWVRVANNEVEKKHSKSNKYTIFAGNNFDLKRRDALNYVLEPYLSRKEYTIIPSEIYHELIKLLGCLPSTGMAFLYWIYKICGSTLR